MSLSIRARYITDLNIIKKPQKKVFWGFVRVKGLEPPRLSTLDPKSSAATNYAIPAKISGANVRSFFKSTSMFITNYK